MGADQLLGIDHWKSTSIDRWRDEWRRLRSLSPEGAIYSDLAWIQAACVDDGIPQERLVLHREGEAIAAWSFDLIKPGAPTHYDIGMLLGDRISPSQRDRLYPVLTVTTRSARTCGLRIAPSLEPASTIASVISATESAADAAGAASIAFLNVSERENELHRRLSAAGYERVDGVTHWVLPLEFSTFEDYLRLFSSHRRQAIKREVRLRSAEPVSVSALSLSEALHSHTDMVALNVRKYGRSRPLDDILKRNTAFANAFGDQAFVVQLAGESQLFASALFVSDGDSYAGVSVGISPAAPATLAAYFNVLFYIPIRLALSQGIKRIAYAFAADDVKASRGCTPIRHHSYIKTTGHAAGDIR